MFERVKGKHLKPRKESWFLSRAKQIPERVREETAKRSDLVGDRKG